MPVSDFRRPEYPADRSNLDQSKLATVIAGVSLTLKRRYFSRATRE
jgi:hypothetical protein